MEMMMYRNQKSNDVTDIISLIDHFQSLPNGYYLHSKYLRKNE